jgi:hypothetical protein
VSVGKRDALTDGGSSSRRYGHGGSSGGRVTAIRCGDGAVQRISNVDGSGTVVERTVLEFGPCGLFSKF